MYNRSSSDNVLTSRFNRNGRLLPLFYFYDSYQVPNEEWRSLLNPETDHSIRGTSLDSVIIGLLVEFNHVKQLTSLGFDGFYTYFASEGFTYGSTSKNWQRLQSLASAKDILFIPSVGPGYIDDRVRPWNSQNTKMRKRGLYYASQFRAAIASGASVVSVTSFNEWHEGTQIEAAVPKSIPGFKYLDYSPESTDFYLRLTRQYVEEFAKQSKQ